MHLAGAGYVWINHPTLIEYKSLKYEAFVQSQVFFLEFYSSCLICLAAVCKLGRGLVIFQRFNVSCFISRPLTCPMILAFVTEGPTVLLAPNAWLKANECEAVFAWPVAALWDFISLFANIYKILTAAIANQVNLDEVCGWDKVQSLVAEGLSDVKYWITSRWKLRCHCKNGRDDSFIFCFHLFCKFCAEVWPQT